MCVCTCARIHHPLGGLVYNQPKPQSEVLITLCHVAQRRRVACDLTCLQGGSQLRQRDHAVAAISRFRLTLPGWRVKPNVSSFEVSLRCLV